MPNYHIINSHTMHLLSTQYMPGAVLGAVAGT